MKRTIAITGATGFVGRAVVERLLDEDDVELRCLARPFSHTAPLQKHGERVRIVAGDILDPKSLRELVEDSWGVINLAGLRGFWASDRSQYSALNETGARNVFEAALEADCQKVVQVSTPLAFGMPSDSPFDETSEPGPHASDYGRSKHRGDEAGWRLQRGAGLPFTVVHLAAVIGAGDPHGTMEVRRAVQGKLPALVGADKTFTYVYIRDAAEAIVRALLNDATVGRRYLIGKARATTRQYFEMISRLAGVAPPSWNIPEAIVLPIARAEESLHRWTGRSPAIPVDVIETSAAGSLLFDATRSEQELCMEYAPLEVALREAVEEILSPPSAE